MDFALIAQYWHIFLEGVLTTVWLVSLSLLIGGVMAIPLAIAQAYQIPYLGRISAIYSYAFRGTPLLVQLYIIYYGLAQFEVIRDSIFWPILKHPHWCALISFSLNSAGYVCEILRGAIVSVPKGETEAAESIGLTRARVVRRIVLPSAMRKSIPAYSNEVIFLLHASVIASTITVTDILGAGRQLNNQYYVVYEGFLTAALLYLILVFGVNRIFKKTEARYLRHLLR